MQKKKKCAESKKFLESKNLIGRKDGITLIALVVTIIILLILAGVALTAMINGGIFDKAKEAAEQTQIGKEKEQIATSYAKYKMESAQGIGTTLTVDGARVTGNDEEGWTITFEDTGNTYKIHPDGKVEETGKVEGNPPGSTVEPTDIYVTLYSDGTLGFSNNEETISGKEVSKSYGNIKGQSGRTWSENKTDITTVEFQNEIVPMGSLAYWFDACSNLTQINNISNLNTSNVTSMENMFSSCSSLQELDLSSFNTSNVTYMNWMFQGCSNLEKLNVSNFDTKNVTSMSAMFKDCVKLKDINVSSFDTSQVTNMGWMFGYCKTLKNLDVSNFNTKNVEIMWDMFDGCTNLVEIELMNLNSLKKELNMNSMFNHCEKLETLDLSKFNTSNVVDMSAMFQCCYSLQQLDLSSFDTSNVTKMNNMFYYCTNLTEVNLRSFATSKVTGMSAMFNNCNLLTELDLSSFDTNSITNMSSMFKDCTNLKVVYGRKDRWITANVTDSSGMWNNCGTNHITYKTYLENNKVVGYEITKCYGWRESGATKVRVEDNRRASCVYFIQLDPEKQYKIEMKNSNYDFGYSKVDIDLKTLFDSGWQSPDKAPIITDTEYMLVSFGSHPSHETQITDEMLNEIIEAFQITLVE